MPGVPVFFYGITQLIVTEIGGRERTEVRRVMAAKVWNRSFLLFSSQRTLILMITYR